MKSNDFTYTLPRELIAQQPRQRGDSRLLVLPRTEGPLRHGSIRDLPELLAKGDCLVVNDSKVLAARVRVRKVETGAHVEVLLLRELAPGAWEALARPGRRLRSGTRLRAGAIEFTVSGLAGDGRVTLDFPTPRAAWDLMRRTGEPPLPPYIRRPAGTNWRSDRARYQTLFARLPGSVAAPTAGLHFSRTLLRSLIANGIQIVPVTLHVGWGTFAPLPEGDLDGLALHPERYSIAPAAAATLNRCRGRGNRIVACGTTVARTLETVASSTGELRAGAGETTLFIRPGYAWRAVDGLLTNFHLPGSSLLMLVCAFGGTERVLAGYRCAVGKKYHFYSYGDAMLLL